MNFNQFEDYDSEDDRLYQNAVILYDDLKGTPVPRPSVLNALASILEAEESRYLEESNQPHSIVTRLSHNIGRLETLVNSGDILPLISSGAFTQPTSFYAAASRLVLSCSRLRAKFSMLYDQLYQNLSHWIGNNQDGKDPDFLRRYSFGLLAICLAGPRHDFVVKHVFDSGLSKKLTQHLNTYVLKNTKLNPDIQKGRGTHVWTRHKRSHGGTLDNEELKIRLKVRRRRPRLIAATSGHAESEMEADIDEEFEVVVLLDDNACTLLGEKYYMQCLCSLVHHPPFLIERGVEFCIALLQRSFMRGEMAEEVLETLQIICANPTSAAQFIKLSGVKAILDVPREYETLPSLSSCLVTIGKHRVVMERISLNSKDVGEIVDLGIHLIGSNQDDVIIRAAIFFSGSFLHLKFLKAFDERKSVRRFLTLIQVLLSRDTSTHTESERNIISYTCTALKDYFRNHLILFLESSFPDKSKTYEWHSDDAIDHLFLQIPLNRELSLAFIENEWAAVGNFLSHHGHIIMLELCQASLQLQKNALFGIDKWIFSVVECVLSILRTVTLVPGACKLILTAKLNLRSSMAVILDVADGYTKFYFKTEGVGILANFVGPPASLFSQGKFKCDKEQISQLMQIYKLGRTEVIENQGLKFLLDLIPRSLMPHSKKILTLVCRVLVGLARDDTIAELLEQCLDTDNLMALRHEAESQTICDEFEKRLLNDFFQVALELIEIGLGGGRMSRYADSDFDADISRPPLLRIKTARLAAETSITYKESDLLQLIHEHLKESGLGAAADSLKNDARLESLLPVVSGRLTLREIIVRYVRLQHQQCQRPMISLPPVSLLEVHRCPSSQLSFDAPVSVTARLRSQVVENTGGGSALKKRDREFVFSKFRQISSSSVQDDQLTCLTFLGQSDTIATGTMSGDVRIFDYRRSQCLDVYTSHASPVSEIQRTSSGHLLSSCADSVALWDERDMPAGFQKLFRSRTSAKFSHSGAKFAALSTAQLLKGVVLYDMETLDVDAIFSPKFEDQKSASSSSHIHFDLFDRLLLWNGNLWDVRSSQDPVIRFPVISNYGGGGFHPAGNEVIINSEVFDCRTSKLLHNVPLLEDTNLAFSMQGDIIYGSLRTTQEDLILAGGNFDMGVHFRNLSHSFRNGFCTVDGNSYSPIARKTLAFRGVGNDSDNDCVVNFANRVCDDSLVGVTVLSCGVFSSLDLHSSLDVFRVGLDEIIERVEDGEGYE